MTKERPQLTTSSASSKSAPHRPMSLWGIAFAERRASEPSERSAGSNMPLGRIGINNTTKRFVNPKGSSALRFRFRALLGSRDSRFGTELQEWRSSRAVLVSHFHDSTSPRGVEFEQRQSWRGIHREYDSYCRSSLFD